MISSFSSCPVQSDEAPFVVGLNFRPTDWEMPWRKSIYKIWGVWNESLELTCNNLHTLFVFTLDNKYLKHAQIMLQIEKSPIRDTV